MLSSGRRILAVAVCLLQCARSLADSATNPAPHYSTSVDANHTDAIFQKRVDGSSQHLRSAEILELGYGNLGRLASDAGTSTAFQRASKVNPTSRRASSYEWIAKNFEKRDLSANPTTLRELAEFEDVIGDNVDKDHARNFPVTGVSVGGPEGAVRMTRFISRTDPSLKLEYAFDPLDNMIIRLRASDSDNNSGSRSPQLNNRIASFTVMDEERMVAAMWMDICRAKTEWNWRRIGLTTAGNNRLRDHRKTLKTFVDASIFRMEERQVAALVGVDLHPGSRDREITAGSPGYTALLGTQSGVLITDLLLQTRHRDDWGHRLIRKVVIGQPASGSTPLVLTWFIEDWNRELEERYIESMAQRG